MHIEGILIQESEGLVKLMQEITQLVNNFGTLLRLTVGSNVEPKCGNNSSESLHVSLLF